MDHQQIVTRMNLIWHSEESIWELSLSSVYSEIFRRMNIKNTLTYAFMCINVQL